MADDPRQKRADRHRVNLSQRHEMSYWVKRFRTTPTLLRKAVKEVGPMVANVQQCLASYKKLKRKARKQDIEKGL